MNSDKKQEIPQYIIDGFARKLYPKMPEFYESDEGKAYFEEWKAEQTTEETKEITD